MGIDEILYAFHVECVEPNEETIEKWVKRYPQFEKEIRRFSEIKLIENDEVCSLELLDRVYLQTLSILEQFKR